MTATVSFRAADGEAIIEEIEVTLTREQRTATEEFTAPVTAGVYTLAVSGQVEETAALRVTVTGASTSVTAVPVAVMLRLSGPAEAVSVGETYQVTVDTNRPVPEGTTLEVTVRARAGTATALQEDVSLTETISRLPVSFTAPARAGEVIVTATAMPQTSSGSRQVAVSEADELTVGVSARDVQLALSEVPVDLVPAESTFSVTVSAAPEMLAGTTVQVTVRLAAFTSESVLLTPGAPTASVLVTAPTAGGSETLRATGEEADDNRLELNVLLAEAAVRVRAAEGTVELTLDAPSSVTVGSTFPVTVEVAEETPLAEDVSVTATVSFRAADGEAIIEEIEVTLTREQRTATEEFTAPVTAGVYTLAVSGQVEETAALRVTVTGASTSVTAVPVAVMLRLSGPAEAVSVGETYQVTVDTNRPVPEGTTLEVTVRARAGTATALQEDVSLTETISRLPVSFTAPARAGEVIVTATAMPQTSSGSRQVAVSEADELTVGVSARDVQLALSEVPVDLVAAESTFSVTVSAAPEMLAGTTVQVTVRLAAFTSESVLLTPGAPTASVLVTAPTAGGSETLRATGEEADDNRLELNVLLAEAAVRVRAAEGTVELTLDAPSSVTVGSTFPVTVEVAEETPLAEDVSVTATVSFRAADGEAIIEEIEVTLTREQRTATEEFTAPVTAGVYTLAVSGQVEETAALRVTVTGASTSVTAVPVAVMLRLSGPAEAVSVGETYQVTVDTNRPVPEGTTLEVTVRARAGTATALQEDVSLTETISRLPVSFTAPARAGEVMVTATAMPQTSSGSRQVAVSEADELTVGVSARDVQLALSEVPVDLVPAESTFSVTVSAAPEMLAGTTVQVTVRLAAFTSESVLLTPGAPTASVLVTAPTAGGSETLRATGEEAADNRLELNVLLAEAAVRVRAAEGTVELTLDAPSSVTVGSTFPVTVEVAEETPLAEDVSVTATVSFRAADGEAIIEEIEVTLTREQRTATEEFTAPVTAGVYTLAVSGQVEETAALRVTVTGASTSVTAVPVAVMLRLSGPAEAVSVGEPYQVTVDTNRPVPEGTTLEVTVRARAGTATALQEDVSLTETISRLPVSFTAPARAGEVMVTATAMPQTSSGSRQVAVSEADELTVGVSARDVQLALSEVPVDLVPAESTFSVTVSAAPEMLAGTTVQVTVRLAAFTSESVLLTPGAPTASVLVTAPTAGGSETLRATGEEADDNRLELNVLLAEAAVRVRAAEGTVELTLDAPSSVTVGSTFPVTVEVAEETPLAEDVSVTATVSFRAADGEAIIEEIEVTLTREQRTATEEFTAPVTAGVYTLAVSGQVEETAALRVTVTGASTSVTAVPVAVMLRLSGPAEAVSVGETYQVTVDTNRPVPEGTTLEVTVRARAGTATALQEDVSLTETISRLPVSFTAPARAGEVMVTATAMPQTSSGSRQVTVSDAMTLTVEVSARDVQLVLSDVPSLVAADSNFSVTVSAAPEMLAGTTVQVTVRLAAFTSESVLLTPGAPTASVLVTAPAAGGSETLSATGEEAADNRLELNVLGAQAAVRVRAAEGTVELTLDAPSSVTVGSTFPVTVEVAEETPLAEDVSVTATVSFRAADGEAIIEEIEVTLTREQRTATEEFTAPVTAGVYTLAVSGQVEETAALRVTVTGASTSVTAVPVAVMLRLNGPAAAVSVGQDYTVMVDTTVAVPAGTTLEVTVRADAGTAIVLQEDVFLTETISRLPVSFTAPARASEVMVTATAMPQTSSGSRQVAVSDAMTLTVEVSARDVQLVLSDVPSLVAADSNFSVTVSAAPEMLAGTTVQVTVRLAAFTSESVLLMPGAPTASVLVTVPAAGGLETLSATGEEAADNRLELNVLAAEAAVQVRVEETVELTLDAPSSVTVGSTFPVTVEVAEETPLAEDVSVTATVSFRAADGEAIIEEIEVTLTREQRTATEEFTAPVTAGVYTLTVSGQVEETAALRVTVTGASAAVTAVPVAVMLRLNGPAEAVSVGQDYTVMVDTTVAVPAGTTLEVTVSADAGTAIALQEDVSLTETISRLPVSFTAPARASEVMVTATAMPQTSSGSRQVAVSDAMTLTVEVSARDVQLVLSDVPSLVAADSNFSVTVSAAPEMLAGTTVQVTVRLAAFTSESVLLTSGAPMASVLVTAPAAGGSETLSATGEEAADNRLELNVLLAEAAVRVRAEGTVELTLDAPSSVTVGSTFPVTIGVAEETPLAEDVSVTATVSFRTADGEEIQAETAVLTDVRSSATPVFRAPVTAGVYTVTVSGQVEETAALRVTVTGASAAVTAVPVAVMLRLNGPAEAVSVGQIYTVMVDTTVAVPAGTTLEVTVSADAGTAIALQEDVSLTETISRLPVSFTAPARASEVMVTATAMPQTSSGSRQVAVSDAMTLAVEVSARDVQLVLSDVPSLVAADSNFSVTVSAAPEMLAGTTVQVTVRLAAFTSESVLLTSAAPTASVLVTAPTAGGSETLRATGEEADDNRLELNVLVAEAAVQVTELVTLELRLSTPSTAVEAGSTFSVMVETDEAVPAGAEVSLTVTFDGVTRPAALSEGEDMTMVEFTAPGTMTGSFPVNATGTASVTDPNALELTVNPASASVEVVPVAIALTLTPTSIVVRANAMFSVEVGTDRELPGGTEVALIVRFGSAFAPVVLSTATMPTDSLEFTAPSEGLLELTAEVSATTQGDIAVEVSEATPVMVQVTRLAALGLRLSTPSAAVAAGSKFSVTVGADAPVPAEVSVLVTFEEFTQPAMLSANTPMAMVEFTAPGTTGTFAVEAAGIAEDSDALELTVNPASASVEVVPMAITLTLTPSSLVVAAGAQLSVEVGTDLALPAGTEVNVELQFNGASTSAVVSSMMPAPSVTFMASSLGELSLTASVITITQSSPVVAVSAPAPLRVRVIRSINLAVVTPSGAEVITGSTFTVTVRTDVPVPAETEMSVIVTFAGSTQTAILSAGEEETTVQLTAPESTGTFTVNATGMASVADPNALELTVNPASAPVQVNALLTILLTVSAPSSVMVGDTFTVTVGVAEGRLLPESISVTATVGFRAANAEELQAETVVLSAAIPSDTRVFTAPVTAGVYTVEVSGQVEEEMEFLRVIVTGANASVIVNPVAVRLRLSGPEAAVPAAQTYMITVDTNVVVPQGTTLRVTVSVNDGIGAQEQEVFLAAGNFSEQVSFTAPGGRAGAVSVRAMVTDVQTAPDALEVAVSNAERLIVRLSALDLQLVPGRDRYAVGSEVTLRVRADAGPMTDTTYSIIAMNIDSTTTFSRAVMHPEGVTEQEVSFPARLFSSTGQWKFSILLPADSPFQAVNSASVFIFPPALSLQPDDVLTIMGLALPTEIYSRSETSGLSGASDAAVSGDLLFVTGDTDNALSVWRVNAEASTLRQIALYENLAQDDENETIRGLSGARNVAVSGDGNLLFVTGPRDHALSVWRVNASSGTLRQTALYQDQNPGANLIADVDGRFIGLSDTRDVAVSDDDDLLFVTSSFYAGLSVWRVNASSGTLRQTALYRNGNPDNENKRVSGLGGAWGLAVSNDLLFVTALGDDALSVWRVNAEAGDLAQTALYQDSGLPPSVLDDRLVNGRVDGLSEAWSLAVSNDLLFVTALGDDALSVWRVNRLAGTLRQTALYQDPNADNRIEEVDGRFDGLDQASVVAVSNDGALLFVSGSDTTGETDLHTLSVWRVNAQAETLTQTARYQSGDQPSVREVSAATVSDDGNLLFVAARGFNVLSVWPINDATVPLEVQTVIRLQSNIPVAQEVMVTVIARNSAGMEKESLVTFSPDSLSEEAIFPAGTLSPGRWIFTAQADLPDALNTGAARTAVRVLLPLLSLEPRQKQFAPGSTVTLAVRAGAGAPTAATYEIFAENMASAMTSSITVMHPENVTALEVSFPSQLFSSPGQWEFSILLPDNSPFRVGDGSTATVRIIIPLLQLVPEQDQYAVGSTVILTVRADVAAPTAATYEIIAENMASAMTSSITVTHPADVTAQEVSFSAQQIASPGQWEFSISLPLGSPFRVGDGSTATVRIIIPLLQLVLEQDQYAVGSEVILTVRADVAAPTAATYEIIAENMASAMTSSITVTHPADVTALEVSFPSQLFSSPGQWEFSILLPDNSPFRVGDGSTATVRIIIPLLQLMPEQDQYAGGSTVILTVRVDVAAPTAATYEILAENMASAMTSSITVMHPENVTALEVSFPSQLFSSPGQWEFSILLPDNSPFRVGDGSTATVRIIIPLLQLVPEQDQYAVGSTVILTVQADVAAPTAATYEILAENMASAMTSSITVTHPEDVTAQEVSFSAQQIASPGQWEFSISLPPGSPFRVGDGSTATVRIIIPLLQLVPQQQHFILGSTVILTVQAEMAAPTAATYEIFAENMTSAMTSFITVTHPKGVTAQEVSFSAQQIASLGQWEFSISLPPGSPFRVGDGSTATVRIVTPLLELVLEPDQLLTAGGTVTLTVRHDTGPPTTISYTVMAQNAILEITSSVLTTHPAGTAEHSVSFSGRQIASPGYWQFSISLPENSLFEGIPITVTISLDFIEPQGIINADDLIFALRYLVRCEGSAEGCQENGETLANLAKNMDPVRKDVKTMPAALHIPDVSDIGEEKPEANWFILLLRQQGLPVELLFPDSKEPDRLKNAIRSMLSVQEESTP